MQKTTLGKTGIEASRVIFGGIICMDELQKDTDRYVSYAIDAGVNFFDVSPSYGNSEEKLGPALKAYRNKANLSCKTTDRTAKGARESIEGSLKRLQTDYFDLFQLHSLAEVIEVDQVFAEDGAMQAVIEAKKAGKIKHIGLTAHNEETAIAALSKFDFETVMFPINWALDMRVNFAKRLPEICVDKNIGILSIKSLAHRKWRNDEEKVFPKSWCKTIFEDERLGVCALKYALSRHVDAIVPPGNFEQFCFAVKHIEECLANPLNDEDIKYLKNSLPSDDEMIFTVTDDGKRTYN